jgi:hypothetical protein
MLQHGFVSIQGQPTDIKVINKGEGGGGKDRRKRRRRKKGEDKSGFRGKKREENEKQLV